jgi:5-methylcytosine-specific restriction endonuclease McrA
MSTAALDTPTVPGTLNLSGGIVRHLRDQVAEPDGWTCHYCGRAVVPPPPGRNHTTAEAPSLATLDHWVPRARGGSWDLDNLVMACRPCNNDKHSLTGDEYLLVLAYRADQARHRHRSGGRCQDHRHRLGTMVPKTGPETTGGHAR